MAAVTWAPMKKKFEDPVYSDEEIEALMRYMQLETYQEFQKIIDGLRPKIFR
jgi:hypothetical protein